jgi:hypothetical protein
MPDEKQPPATENNEVTLTVKLNDRDYDDLERWASVMKLPGGIGALLASVLMPAEQVRKFIADCRKAEADVRSKVRRR